MEKSLMPTWLKPTNYWGFVSFQRLSFVALEQLTYFLHYFEWTPVFQSPFFKKCEIIQAIYLYIAFSVITDRLSDCRGHYKFIINEAAVDISLEYTCFTYTASSTLGRKVTINGCINNP